MNGEPRTENREPQRGKFIAAHDSPAPPAADAEPTILPLPADVQQLRIAGSGPKHGRAAHIQVVPDIARRVTIAEPGPDQPEPRDLDSVVHRVLIIGLALSTLLMLIGVGLELLRGTALPDVVAGVGELLPRLLALRPSGFLTLGLLALIATPILRVIGSIATFIYEHDWRFAGITTLVLLVLLASVMLGK